MLTHLQLKMYFRRTGVGVGSPEHGLSTVTRLILSMRAANKQLFLFSKFIPPGRRSIHVRGKVHGLSLFTPTCAYACAQAVGRSRPGSRSPRHQVFRARPAALSPPKKLRNFLCGAGDKASRGSDPWRNFAEETSVQPTR